MTPRASEATADASAASAPVARGSGPRLGWNPALDGVRGLAVLMVVLVHVRDSLWQGANGWLFRGGQLSVHLFFVLSGFLITTIALGEADRTGRIRLGRFAARRARRILPLVVAFLAVLAIIAAVGTRLTSAQVASTAGHTLTFTSNSAVVGSPNPLVTRLGGQPQIISETMHTWTLSVEVQFYALWALCLWAAVRLRWTYRRMLTATLLLVAVVAVVRAVLFARGDVWWMELFFSTWSRLDAPFVGSLVGICFVAGWLREPPRWLVPVGTACALVFLACSLSLDWTVGALPAGLYTVLAGVAGLAIAAMVAVPDCHLARVLGWRPLALLGLVSYSLYIWHYPIFDALRRHPLDLPDPLQAAVALALALLATTVSYLLIERPVLRRRTPRSAAIAPSSPTPVGTPVAEQLAEPVVPATVMSSTPAVVGPERS